MFHLKKMFQNLVDVFFITNKFEIQFIFEIFTKKEAFYADFLVQKTFLKFNI